MELTLQKFEDRPSMATALADVICERLEAAIAARGAAGLIVSGGSAPIPLFAELARRELPWERITVSLADERWVDPASPDSNERLVRTTLLTQCARHARFVALKTRHALPEQGELECESALATVPSPFDVVVLGMGEDGHTASLFPGADRLAAALDLKGNRQCLAITPKVLPSNAPYPRMTLTLRRLLDSRWIALLLAGQPKLDVYRQALAGDEVESMPVRAVLQQTRTPVVTYWAP
jgi:6-phosphogluconolactonase